MPRTRTIGTRSCAGTAAAVVYIRLSDENTTQSWYIRSLQYLPDLRTEALGYDPLLFLEGHSVI